MSDTVLKIENISKQYRLGQLGTGTISHDLNRFWAKLRGKEDPYLKVGDTNDRSKAGGSDYVWSLKDINFEVKQGEVLGIIGKNGAGKSTLLKILSQVTTPTTGQVKVKGRIAALLEVGTGFHPDLSGLENIFLNGAILGMTKTEIKSKLDEIVDFSGVAKYLDTPVKRYSSGMMVRLGFAVAAHLEPEILIVDEVLAVGDVAFQNKCMGKMSEVSKQGRTILFVSHNMQAMSKLCTRGILLNNGKLVVDCSIKDAIKKYLDENATSNAVYIIEPPADKDELNAYVQKIQIEDNEGNLMGGFPVGKGWQVRIFFKVNKKTEHFICGIGISSSMGVDVNTSWSDHQDIEVGEYEGLFEQKDILFCAGSYMLAVGLSSYERTIQFLPNIATFIITEPAIKGLDARILRTSNSGLLLNPMAVKLIKV
ncbi:MAG TPA: ABC transporter ATP-binding protein [Bacteroidia bacterium]